MTKLTKRLSSALLPALPALAVLILLGGCKSAPDSHPDNGNLQSPATPDCAACIPEGHTGARLSGTVAVEGPEPLVRTVLRRDGAGSVTLGGDRIPELQRLSSMRVEIALADSVEAPGSDRVLDPMPVEHFRVLEVHGVTPVTGHVYIPGGDESPRLHTDRGERLRLPGFRATGSGDDWHGAAIWVLGQREDNRLIVQRFGMIRPGGDARQGDARQ